MSSNLNMSDLSPEDKQNLMKQWEAEKKEAKLKKQENRKAFRQLTAEFVDNNIDDLVNHNDITGILIEKLFKDYAAIKELKEELYGKTNQANHTSTLADGSASITIGHNVTINFDGTESAGIEKIKLFIASLSDDDSNTKKLIKMSETFLKLNPKTGSLNPSKIIELSKLKEEFNDDQFNEGLEIIFNAQIRTQNSMYVSGWKYIQVKEASKKLTFRFSV